MHAHSHTRSQKEGDEGNNRQIHQFSEYKQMHVDKTYHTCTQSSHLYLQNFLFFFFYPLSPSRLDTKQNYWVIKEKSLENLLKILNLIDFLVYNLKWL